MNRLLGSLVIFTSIVIGCALTSSQAAQAQTFTIIHAFSGQDDGSQPAAGLTLNGDTLYGTTAGALPGQGTVFQMKHTNGSWSLNTLAVTGSFPAGRAVRGPDGALYGTTHGASGGPFCEFGCGTVYELRAPNCFTGSCFWNLTDLYIFMGGSDGFGPVYVDPVFDPSGNLYATAEGGGATGAGVLFELVLSGGGWTQTVIHNFNNDSGSVPLSGVILDQAGNLYGTTSEGGLHGSGVVYQLTPSESGWTETILYSFAGGSDGGSPAGGLILDQSGNLYGTTTSGGSGGGGTVFELAPSEGSWDFTLLHSWSGTSNGGPHASLVMDSAGSLYGATYTDGASGAGSVFKLTRTDGGWLYTDLHDFAGRQTARLVDGANPTGSVIVDAQGNVYGTTVYGGIQNGNCNPGCGVVWEITP